MQPISTIIIDDESLARELVRRYASDIEPLNIVAECGDGFEALRQIQEHKPDLLFLDIQMPKLDGFELLEVLDYNPAIIFTTAYDQFAIKAFEMNAVDYLLKPFSKDRFESAVQKAIQRIAIETGSKQLVQLRQSLQILGMIVARLSPDVRLPPGACSAGHACQLHHRDAVAQKLWQCKLFRLKDRVGRLDAEGDALAMPLRRRQRQLPYRVQIQPPRLLLHIAPVAANVEHIDKGQARHLLHVVFQCLPAFAHGDGRATFLPRITDQA